MKKFEFKKGKYYPEKDIYICSNCGKEYYYAGKRVMKHEKTRCKKKGISNGKEL